MFHISLEDTDRIASMEIKEGDIVVPVSDDEAKVVLRKILKTQLPAYDEQYKQAAEQSNSHKNEMRYFEKYLSRGANTLNISVNIIYKPKHKKINPLDNIPSDGSVPDGNTNWREKK
jgi:hypothetical protein